MNFSLAYFVIVIIRVVKFIAISSAFRNHFADSKVFISRFDPS